MNDKRDVTVCFVSGKGGVGKTMLAVAFAREVSIKSRTLLLDLDFFNRGLTGLMRHGKAVKTLAAPQFLGGADSGEAVDDLWRLTEIAPSLYHVSYPDLSPNAIQSLGDVDVQQLIKSLTEYLSYLKATSECDVIVMDCHGGPDQLSFAACVVADHSLLVSEPDKITFYGTLHFVRQMERVAPREARKIDLHLIFNKVVPAFSAPYLNRFYEQHIRQYFSGHPLLAIFPLEIYLTKEFERTPFLTNVYPYSQLAKKTRVLIFDLFAKCHADIVPSAVLRASRLRRRIIRYSLGRVPAVVDLNRVLAIIAIGSVAVLALAMYVQKSVRGVQDFSDDAIVLAISAYAKDHPDHVPTPCKAIDDPHALYSCFMGSDRTQVLSVRFGYPSALGLVDHVLANKGLENSSNPQVFTLYKKLAARDWGHVRMLLRLKDELAKHSEWLATVAVAWFLAVIVLNWSVILDRIFTYNSRGYHRVMEACVLLVASAMWVPPMILSGLLLKDIVNDWTVRPAFGLSLGFFVLVLSNQFFKAYQNMRFERRIGEGMIRLSFLAYIIGVLCVSFFIFS